MAGRASGLKLLPEFLQEAVESLGDRLLLVGHPGHLGPKRRVLFFQSLFAGNKGFNPLFQGVENVHAPC